MGVCVIYSPYYDYFIILADTEDNVQLRFAITPRTVGKIVANRIYCPYFLRPQFRFRKPRLNVYLTKHQRHRNKLNFS